MGSIGIIEFYRKQLSQSGMPIPGFETAAPAAPAPVVSVCPADGITAPSSIMGTAGQAYGPDEAGTWHVDTETAIALFRSNKWRIVEPEPPVFEPDYSI
jgi:hypothetical protein